MGRSRYWPLIASRHRPMSSQALPFTSPSMRTSTILPYVLRDSVRRLETVSASRPLLASLADRRRAGRVLEK